MNKKRGHAIRKALMALFLLLCSSTELKVYASDGQEYITISVDATDENGNLLYAIDTDDPSAFTSSNEFSVPAGTHHTIYVKDAAGNISSQEFNPVEANAQEGETDNRTVNIDVTLNDTPEQSKYGSLGISDPAESGQGTIYEKVTTDAADQNAERIFYTITTDEGEVFYMVIDQGQSSNNVYLLDQVNLSDLKTLAVDDSGETATEESSSLLSALSSDDQNAEINSKDTETSNTSKRENTKNTMMRNLIFLLIFTAAGGGYYYYKNIYKGKKDEQMDLLDALDKEDFVAEDEADEEADFGLDEDYQEQVMKQLIEEDDKNDLDENKASGENYITHMQKENLVPAVSTDTMSHKDDVDDKNFENIEEDDDDDEDFDDEEDE